MTSRSPELTMREVEALRARALAESNKDAAARLFVTEQTLKNLLTHAYRKVGAQSAVEAFRKLGWLMVPEP